MAAATEYSDHVRQRLFTDPANYFAAKKSVDFIKVSSESSDMWSEETKFRTPLVHINGGLDLLYHMGQDPDVVIDRPAHARFQLLACICFHLLQLCLLEFVLADHQRTIHPFLEKGR
jgi:hypothetical protein